MCSYALCCYRSSDILPGSERRFQPIRLSALTSTYHLVACLFITGNIFLVDQTTDGSIRFVTTPQHALDVMEISNSPWPWHRSHATALAGYAKMMMPSSVSVLTSVLHMYHVTCHTNAFNPQLESISILKVLADNGQAEQTA